MGFPPASVSCLEELVDHGLSPDEFAYNALIDALLQKGLVDMAHKYDEEMLMKGLSAKPRAELQTTMNSEGSNDGTSSGLGNAASSQRY
ncbi:UNVERIFIED_CONTAM: Pentatricopeptide repeat-containing protein, mitochondrial [Sesamum calycinum]|uniref:Pentatricopeptide repeat-containing protein, mitochondrial n=1 Tax=Sesamum calycinum TaxID=2727403 RepID=A0AAW2NG24_9LAMI